MKKFLVSIVLLGVTSSCFAGDLSSLSKQLSDKIKQSQPKQNTTSSDSSYVPPEISIRGRNTYYRTDLYMESRLMEYLNGQILENCIIYTQPSSPIVVDYKITFHQNNVKNVKILKGTGDSILDKKIVDRIKDIVAQRGYGILNNGNTMYFKGQLYTTPLSQYTPVYVLSKVDNETNKTIPEEQKEYFNKLNNKLNENFQNKNNLDGETIMFIKFNKKGELISVDQYDLLNEVNRITSQNLTNNQIPSIPYGLFDEIISSIRKTFPIQPLDTKSNNIIVVKSYKAEHTSWIKKEDKAITKVGKGILMGIAALTVVPILLFFGVEL